MVPWADHVGRCKSNAYDDFTRMVLEWYERKDPKEYFGELTRFKQAGSAEAYISKFLRLSMMVPDL